MTVSEQTFLRLIAEDPKGKWELHRGELRSKPAMTWDHDRVACRLGFRLQQQLNLDEFEVRVDAGHVRRSETEYFIPDVMVIPLEQARTTFTVPGITALYPWPLPLVVEVWSPSTGSSDINTKLPEYQRRGDAEIWLFHVSRLELNAWVRQPDGSYAQITHRGGQIQPAALPNVHIDLDELFRLTEGQQS